MIGLERQQIIGALIDSELRNGRLAADGSIVTKQPVKSSARNNSGMAVISFDLSATFR